MPIRTLCFLSLFILAALGAKVRAQLAEEPAVSAWATPARSTVAPGDQLAVAITMQFAPGFHVWPNKPVLPKALQGLEPYPTTLVPPPGGLPAGVTAAFVHAQWPEPHLVDAGALSPTPVKILSYSDRAVIYLPVLIAADAPPGKVTLNFGVDLQACNERICLATETIPVSVELTVAAAGTEVGDGGAADPALFADFDPTVWAAIASGASIDTPPPPEAGTTRFDFIGWEFHVESSAYILILGIAFLAGIIMNFTPCVLPVVPIKVMSLQQQAKTPGTLTILSLVYCLGIVATFAVLGLLAFGILTGGQKFDWGQIFSYGWFSLVMAAIVGAMALGMMGLFTIRLPQAVYMINPSHDSLHGNFLFGVLTAILAVPCTGPLLGATLAWVGTQTPALGLATFIVMGAGMAFPYALLLAFPRLIDRLPRTGPGSELLKQVLGILMVAVAIFLATNAIDIGGRGWLVGGVAALAWIWAIVGGFRMLRTSAGKSRNAVLAGGMLAVTLVATWFMTRPGPTEWLKFKNRPDAEIRAAIDNANAEGKTVVVDFTAKWCSNCHVIEELTLNSEVGRQVLARADVLPIKVDLSNAGQNEGWGIVREISGGGGIPLIAVFRPGQASPVYFQSFFKASDLEAAVVGTELAKAGLPPP
jgi:thiol:disulfide interchange protein